MNGRKYPQLFSWQIEDAAKGYGMHSAEHQELIVRDGSKMAQHVSYVIEEGDLHYRYVTLGSSRFVRLNASFILSGDSTLDIPLVDVLTGDRKAKAFGWKTTGLNNLLYCTDLIFRAQNGDTTTFRKFILESFNIQDTEVGVRVRVELAGAATPPTVSNNSPFPMNFLEGMAKGMSAMKDKSIIDTIASHPEPRKCWVQGKYMACGILIPAPVGDNAYERCNEDFAKIYGTQQWYLCQAHADVIPVSSFEFCPDLKQACVDGKLYYFTPEDGDADKET